MRPYVRLILPCIRSQAAKDEEVHALKASVADLEGQVAALKAEVGGCRLTNLNGGLSALGNRPSDFYYEHACSSLQVASKTSDVDHAADNARKALEDQKRTSFEESRSKDEEIQALKKSVTDLEGQVTTLKAEVRDGHGSSSKQQPLPVTTLVRGRLIVFDYLGSPRCLARTRLTHASFAFSGCLENLGDGPRSREREEGARGSEEDSFCEHGGEQGAPEPADVSKDR